MISGVGGDDSFPCRWSQLRLCTWYIVIWTGQDEGQQVEEETEDRVLVLGGSHFWQLTIQTVLDNVAALKVTVCRGYL